MNTIAKLVRRADHFICSECRMRQHYLTDVCEFCGATFSNYDEILMRVFMEQENVNR